MIKDLYKTYFQKSKVFVFPLLGINKKADFLPIKTYLAWQDMYTIKQRKLIVLYNTQQTEEWNLFHNKVLLGNKFFEKLYIQNDVNIYVFDLNFYKEDYDNIILGKYSKLTNLVRTTLQNYFGYHTSQWDYIETFLTPLKHFKLYAEMLDVPEKTLQEVGELCAVPDFSKELLTLELIN